MFHRLVIYVMACMLPSLSAERCVWKMTLSKSLNITELRSHLLSDMTHVDVTSTINQMDVVCLKQSSQESFYASTYNMILEIDCSAGRQQDEAARRSRGIMLQGGQPFVKMCSFPLQEANRAAVCRLAGAVLFDLSQYNGGHCSEEICEPAWVLPIQWDENSLSLTVEVDGGLSYVKPTRITLNMHGYQILNTSAVDVFTLLQNPTSPVDINFIPGKFNAMIWGPLHPAQSLYLSYDDFSTALLLQFMDVGSLSSVCPCLGSEPHVLKSAALADRLLILTQAGLHEVSGEFILSSSTSVESTLVFSLCARDLIVPAHGSAYKQQILLVGGCSADSSIYAAEDITKTGSSLVFQRLPASSDEGPCNTTVDTGCSVVTCASSAFNNGRIFCLLSTDSHYSFVHYTGSTWQKLTDLPLSVTVPTYTLSDDVRPLSWYTDVSGTPQNIIISRITLSPQVTMHLYITGSHILHSPDAGKNFYLMSWSISGSVTLTCASRSGYIIFITELNEIWASQIGHSKAEQIYPSMAWQVVHRIHGLPIPNSQINIVSAFFDTDDDLQLLLLEDGVVGKHAVPLSEILLMLATSHHWLNTISGSALVEVSSPCVFSHLYFDTPSQIEYTRTKLYAYSPPLRSPSQIFHSWESLIMYHALIDNLESYETVLYAKSQSQQGKYGDNYISYVQKWKSILNASQPYDSFLYEIGLLGDGVHVDLGSYHRVFTDSNDNVNELPAVIYLGYNQNYTLYIFLTVDNQPPGHDPLKSLDELIVFSETPNPELLLISDERSQFGFNNTVKYQVTIADSGVNMGQSQPGFDVFPSSVTLTVSQAPLKCMHSVENKIVPMGRYVLDVLIGCAPAQYVVFDWQAAWRKLDESEVMETPYDCVEVDPELPCFFFSNTLYPYFNIHDDATGDVSRFERNYTLKVIGGKVGKNDEMEMFTGVEISNYNRMDGSTSDTSLIWSPMDEQQSSYDGWPVYSNSTNAISWLCQSRSSCARIMPRFPKAPEYHFLVEFSNKDVDHHSYCDYTQTFLLHVHGLPISNTKTSTALVAACIVVVCIHVAIYYAFHRNQSKLWNQMFASSILRIQRFYRRIHPTGDVEPERDDIELKKLSQEDITFNFSHNKTLIEESEDEIIKTCVSDTSSECEMSRQLSPSKQKPSGTKGTPGSVEEMAASIVVDAIKKASFDYLKKYSSEDLEENDAKQNSPISSTTPRVLPALGAQNVRPVINNISSPIRAYIGGARPKVPESGSQGSPQRSSARPKTSPKTRTNSEGKSMDGKENPTVGTNAETTNTTSGGKSPTHSPVRPTTTGKLRKWKAQVDKSQSGKNENNNSLGEVLTCLPAISLEMRADIHFDLPTSEIPVIQGPRGMPVTGTSVAMTNAAGVNTIVKSPRSPRSDKDE